MASLIEHCALLGDTADAALVGRDGYTTQRCRDDSLILESDWATDDDAVRVIDTMPPREEVADVVRVVVGLRGQVPMTLPLRFDFDTARKPSRAPAASARTSG